MKPVIWKDDKVLMVDQRRLPVEEVWNTYRDADGVAEAIKTMVVRGAPAIGVAAAYGLALEVIGFQGDNRALLARLEEKSTILEATRPTAINLKWALDRVLLFTRSNLELDGEQLRRALVDLAIEIQDEDVRLCKAIGDAGAELIPEGSQILTHCNAGALATGDYGTALGVIRSSRNKIKQVWVDETRPFLQGARLTAWELLKEEIPCRLICDNMAGHLMQRGMVDAVVVGADRITSNGSVANKIGTYTLAVLCHFHKIPLYVAAPYSTVDLNLTDGMDIPIEERDSREITHVGSTRIAPEGVKVANPAFDVTPPELVSAIITEKGIIRAPYSKGLAEVVAMAGAI